MILTKEQFPITIQAYELTGDTETFIAEQLVNNQTDVDNFSNRYAGKLIKAKVVPVTTNHTPNAVYSSTTTSTTRKKSSGGVAFAVILLIIIILLAIGWYTGWIQRTFGINA